MIEVKDLTKSYGSVQALRGVNFEVPRGQVVGLLGPNGAGKSTAMRILTGFVGATSGSAKIDGREVADDPVAAQHKIGYLPEGNPLYLDLRLIESLRFAAEMQGLRGAGRDQAINSCIDMVGLAGKERQTIGTFSKGYRQRVGLAQALLHSPPILILDEPTSGLDPNQQDHMRQLIRHLGEERTIILSTHILPEVEASCSRALIINEGTLVAEGTVDEIRAQASGAARVRVVVRADEAAARGALEALTFVSETTVSPAASSGCVEVVLSLNESPEPALLEAVSQAVFTGGLALSELAVDRASLETIFARLTGAETQAGEAITAGTEDGADDA